MRRRFALLALGAMLVLGGCTQVESMLPPDKLDCGGTEATLCQAVARLAVAQMNLTATGPITLVTLTAGDCKQLAQSSFVPAARTATSCWQVEVTGRTSHGGGAVLLQPDGTLQPFW